MSGNKDKLIAFNYFGGKFVWLEYLYDNFPPHFTHLIDLFAGSLCVSLNYRGRVIRTANEINGATMKKNLSDDYHSRPTRNWNI